MCVYVYIYIYVYVYTTYVFSYIYIYTYIYIYISHTRAQEKPHPSTTTRIANPASRSNNRALFFYEVVRGWRDTPIFEVASVTRPRTSTSNRALIRVMG